MAAETVWINRQKKEIGITVNKQEKKMNNKMNYKKGKKNELLRLIYLCGVIPYRSLRTLAKEPRLYQRAVKDMEREGILAVDKKGGEKNIRLLNRAERRNEYEKYLTPEYVSYYENYAYENVHRLNFGDKSSPPASAMRGSATQIMMYKAGADISPYKRDISKEMLQDEDSVYYTSMEIKRAENYRDKVETVKRNDGTILKKLNNTRVTGLLVSPGGQYAVYNTGNTLIEWKRYGEVKMAVYLVQLVKSRSESETSVNIPKEAVIMAQTPGLYAKICNGEAKENKKRTLLNIDFAYDRMYAVPEDQNGILMLKMMQERGWRYTVYKTVLTDEEMENARYVTIQCDGYDKEKDIYKLVFCVPDLVSLKQFTRRAKLENDKKRFAIYCFTCQLPYLLQIADRKNFTILTMGIEQFYDKYFRKEKKMDEK